MTSQTKAPTATDGRHVGLGVLKDGARPKRSRYQSRLRAVGGHRAFQTTRHGWLQVADVILAQALWVIVVWYCCSFQHCFCQVLHSSDRVVCALNQRRGEGSNRRAASMASLSVSLSPVTGPWQFLRAPCVGLLPVGPWSRGRAQR